MVDIDVMQWIKSQLKPQMVEPDKALPGRDSPVLSPIPEHLIFGIPLDEEPPGSAVAYFAMGCYWGVERIFWRLPGVVNTAVGFMGGYTPNPTYAETCTGSTGHTETAKVVFDPSKVTYSELLRHFWEQHDPTTANRQGNDIGTQYRSEIFVTSPEQRTFAEQSMAIYQEELSKAGRGQISTLITDAGPFFFAEEEHQQYLEKNPNGYCNHGFNGVSCRLP